MSTPPTALKEIIGISAPRPTPTPVFTGDQRARILALISTALRDGRQAAVLGALQKDPSLSLENIPDPSSRSGGEIPFALACMKDGWTRLMTTMSKQPPSPVQEWHPTPGCLPLEISRHLATTPV